jgi:hypothetical protein
VRKAVRRNRIRATAGNSVAAQQDSPAAVVFSGGVASAGSQVFRDPSLHPTPLPAVSPDTKPVAAEHYSGCPDEAWANTALPQPDSVWQQTGWAAPLVERWERDPAFTWPRLLTQPHPDAVGTFGWDAVAWAEARRLADSRVPAAQKRLRGFQVLRLVAGLQHDAQGRLLVGTRLESTPRQQGKSVGLSEEALWRMHSAALFGEQQLVMHTAKDLAVAREVQREARLWAGDRGYTVRGTHGQEEIEHEDGSRWLIRGRDSVYSYSAGLAIVDEAWWVDSRIVDDGLEPTLVERVGGQLLLISTAHKRATELFPERRRAAIRRLGERGGRTILAEWSAPADADPVDPLTWRTATAHWTERRADFLADKVGRAGWQQQWLNVWPDLGGSAPLNAWLSAHQLEPLTQGRVAPAMGTAAQVAVELSDTHRAWGVAASWVDANGRVVVVTDGGEGGLEAALVVVRRWVERWPGGRLWAHQSVAARMPPGFPTELANVRQSDAAGASALFRDLVLERRVRLSGSGLAEQVESVVVRTIDGREVIDQKHSRGPVPVVKAATWAAWASALAGAEVAAVY